MTSASGSHAFYRTSAGAYDEHSEISPIGKSLLEDPTMPAQSDLLTLDSGSPSKPTTTLQTGTNADGDCRLVDVELSL